MKALGGFFYSESSVSMGIEVTNKDINGLYYSLPSSPLNGLEVVNVGIAFDNSYVVDGITYHNRQVKIVADSSVPAKLRMSFNNEPFDDMPFVVTDTVGTHHEGFITFPVSSDGAKLLYVKLVNESGHLLAFGDILNVVIDASPIGPDSSKLLRLRKFSKGGLVQRWNGKEIEFP